MVWDRIQSARKVHRCTECGRSIQPGERYRSQGSKDGGDFYAMKFCQPCAVKLEVVVTEPGVDACDVTTLELHDQVSEMARSSGWRKVRALLAAAKAKLFGAKR
jgi:hypothetical protein